LHEGLAGVFSLFRKTPPQAAGKNDHSWYEKIVKPIATVRSVEEFWACYSHLVRPNELVSPSDYHLFKQGISPLWEDEANSKGGKWMVRLRKGLASEKWESLILALVGDSTGVGEEICGCVASIRYQEDIIAVWNRDASDEGKKQKICEAMRAALDLPKGTVLEYKVGVCSLFAYIALTCHRKRSTMRACATTPRFATRTCIGRRICGEVGEAA
jgi:hypothetical protein